MPLAPFDAPFCIILNLAVGGNFPGFPPDGALPARETARDLQLRVSDQIPSLSRIALPAVRRRLSLRDLQLRVSDQIPSLQRIALPAVRRRLSLISCRLS